MDQNRVNPFNSITLVQDQARLRNCITTNGQNFSRESHFANHNQKSNYGHYSTSPSIQDLEAEILRLTLSSSTNTSNIGHCIRSHKSFEHKTDQYPLIENELDIEFDYIPVGPRNNRGGTRVRSPGTDEVDYNTMLRLIEGGNLRKTRIIIDHIHELMVDRVGNCFVQTLLEKCDDRLIDHLLFSVTRRRDLFGVVCLDNLGHQALVKLMDRLKHFNQQSVITSEISHHLVTLAKNSHAGHEVLKRCFLSLSREANEVIMLVIAKNCLELARDQAGCRILQICIQYATREEREVLFPKLIQDAENLSRHAYGNYVIQCMIEAKMGLRIMKELKNTFVELCLNKHGSNVVEKCLSCCEDCADEIIFEIMENDENLVEVCKNEYGNYVIQTAIFLSKGETNSLLVRAIKRHWNVLQFHPYGKSVTTAIKRISKKSRSPVF